MDTSSDTPQPVSTNLRATDLTVEERINRLQACADEAPTLNYRFFSVEDVKAMLAELTAARLAQQEGERQLREVLHEVQRVQPAGSPPPGGASILTSWIIATVQERIAAAESRLTEALEQLSKETLRAGAFFEGREMLKQEVAELQAKLTEAHRERDQLGEQLNLEIGKRQEIAELTAKLTEAEQQREQVERRAKLYGSELDGYHEREAACCPEDVGFPEFIASLQKRLAAADARAEEKGRQLARAQAVNEKWDKELRSLEAGYDEMLALLGDAKLKGARSFSVDDMLLAVQHLRDRAVEVKATADPRPSEDSSWVLANSAFDCFTLDERRLAMARFAELQYPSVTDRLLEAVDFVIRERRQAR